MWRAVRWLYRQWWIRYVVIGAASLFISGITGLLNWAPEDVVRRLVGNEIADRLPTIMLEPGILKEVARLLFILISYGGFTIGIAAFMMIPVMKKHKAMAKIYNEVLGDRNKWHELSARQERSRDEFENELKPELERSKLEIEETKKELENIRQQLKSAEIKIKKRERTIKAIQAQTRQMLQKWRRDITNDKDGGAT